MHTIFSSFNKRPTPLYFYPEITRRGLSVQSTLSDAALQADILQYIDHKMPFGAAVRMSELWCEAKAFGANVLLSDGTFPIVAGALERKIEVLAKIKAPAADNAVMAPMYESVRLAAAQKTKPLLAGSTGPFTLAGILNDSVRFAVSCRKKPEACHALLRTVTDYLKMQIRIYKEAGADGCIIAEPSICMVSPNDTEHFSNAYLQEIIDELQDEHFAIIYHNCGPVNRHLSSIYKLTAAGFHFGNEVDLDKALETKPSETFLMGNTDPMAFIYNKPSEVAEKLTDWRNRYGSRKDIIWSTGCDLAPEAKEECLALI